MAEYPDFPQYSFDEDNRIFDKLVNGPLSYRALYLRAEVCPCWDEDRSSPDPFCAICKGKGTTWTEPTVRTWQDTRVYGRAEGELLSKGGVLNIERVEDDYGMVYAGVSTTPAGGLAFSGITPERGERYTVTYRAPEGFRMHAESVRTRRSYGQEGEAAAGDLEASIPRRLEDLQTPNPAWLAAEHDRIVLPDLQRRHQQRLTVGTNERLVYPRVHQVLSVRAKVGDELVRYAVDDLELSKVGDVTWLSGPPQGTNYVLEYVAAPEYYVYDEIPQMRHVSGQELPRRVHLKLFELYPYRAG